jgi:hypothetical protein
MTEKQVLQYVEKKAEKVTKGSMKGNLFALIPYDQANNVLRHLRKNNVWFSHSFTYDYQTMRLTFKGSL